MQVEIERNFGLTGKKAAVSGSTQGIGRAIAEELAAQGVSVTLLARNEEALNQVASALSTRNGQKHDYLVADFADPENLDRSIRSKFPSGMDVDILVNNSGGPPPGPVSEAELDAFRTAFSMHLLCNQVLAKAILPGMKKRKFGRIVNIISTSVLQPSADLGVSNTIRAGVANWARTLAVEVGRYGITVNNVLPGGIDTERLKNLFKRRAERDGISIEEARKALVNKIPAGRLGSSAEIAYVVAFLSSSWGSYVNGVNLPIDGGRLACQ